MEKQSLTTEFRISSFDLNPGGFARLTALANFFQEIAYRHATKLGFGYHDLKDKGTFWVLSRMRIRVERYPIWDEVIEVETWPNGIDRIFAVREFRVRDKQGETIAVASTGWLVVDIESRRPLRAADLFHRFPGQVESVFETGMGKIRLPENMDHSGLIRVTQSDLDVIGHVNNVKYLEWSLNVLPLDNEEYRSVREMEINFMHESLRSDEIGIRLGTNGSGTYFLSGTRTSDNQEIFRTRIFSPSGEMSPESALAE